MAEHERGGQVASLGPGAGAGAEGGAGGDGVLFEEGFEGGAGAAASSSAAAALEIDHVESDLVGATAGSASDIRRAATAAFAGDAPVHERNRAVSQTAHATAAHAAAHVERAPGGGRTFARRGATFVKTRAAHRDGAWKAQCGLKSATDKVNIFNSFQYSYDFTLRFDILIVFQ